MTERHEVTPCVLATVLCREDDRWRDAVKITKGPNLNDRQDIPGWFSAALRSDDVLFYGDILNPKYADKNYEDCWAVSIIGVAGARWDVKFMTQQQFDCFYEVVPEAYVKQMMAFAPS